MRRSFRCIVFALVLPRVAGASDPLPLKTDAAIPGYFRAASAREDRKAFGGYARSDNLSNRLNRPVPPEKLSLIALPQEQATFGSYRGFTVLLASATSREVAFEAADSRLSIVREARDANGEWRPIEYLPSSWCGNSYHRVFLPAGHYWRFRVPEYAGSFLTKMRFVLTYGKNQRLHSNEFEGFVNLSQFEKRQPLPDGGWMDPYTPQPPQSN
jgi:hypothetical protein